MDWREIAFHYLPTFDLDMCRVAIGNMGIMKSNQTGSFKIGGEVLKLAKRVKLPKTVSSDLPHDYVVRLKKYKRRIIPGQFNPRSLLVECIEVCDRM